MTFGGALTLLLIMTSLAALPGTSSVLVMVQRVRAGLAQALAVITGMLVVDMAFVALALLGMSALASGSSLWMLPLQLLAAGYLIWLGFSLWRSAPGAQEQTHHKGLLARFLAGALVTVADIKALVFYAGLLPQIVNMETLTQAAALWVLAITLVSVAGVKLVYAAGGGIYSAALGTRNVQCLAQKTRCLFVDGAWVVVIVLGVGREMMKE